MFCGVVSMYSTKCVARCRIRSTALLDVTPCSVAVMSGEISMSRHVPPTLSYIFTKLRGVTSGNFRCNIHSRVNLKSHRPSADERSGGGGGVKPVEIPGARQTGRGPGARVCFTCLYLSR
jgi:hypothetical protein